MILKLIYPHSINLGEDLEFIANFHKGKKFTKDIENLRPLFKGVNSNKEYLMMNHLIPIFNFEEVDLDFTTNFIRISPTQLNNGVYKYHYMDHDISKVEDILSYWRNSDPMVHLGNYTHQTISKIQNYHGAYEFNGKIY